MNIIDFLNLEKYPDAEEDIRLGRPYNPGVVKISGITEIDLDPRAQWKRSGNLPDFVGYVAKGVSKNNSIIKAIEMEYISSPVIDQITCGLIKPLYPHDIIVSHTKRMVGSVIDRLLSDGFNLEKDVLHILILGPTGLHFGNEVIKHLYCQYVFDFIEVEKVDGEFKIIKTPVINFDGKWVLVLDVLLEDGFSLDFVSSRYIFDNVKKKYSAVLINNIERYFLERFFVDFSAICMYDDHAIFGYGIELQNGKLRSLRDIFLIE